MLNRYLGLAEKISGGDLSSAARLISGVEEGQPGAYSEIENLKKPVGGAYVIGLTGSPGAGKSTIADGLAGRLLEQGFSVGIIAVDPSSPRSGGAILGDRIRLRKRGGVFFRSLASRGQTGGLSKAVPAAIQVLDALGKDVILLETVGSGQSDVSVADVTHTTVLVLVPGMGDDIQLLKAGIMEIADVFVVNKASREGAESLLKSLGTMTGNQDMHRGDKAAVVATEAVCGDGIAALTEELLKRRRGFVAAGTIKEKKQPASAGG